MKNLNTFQVVIMVIFGVFAIIGVWVFASKRAGNSDVAQVRVWGTEDRAVMSRIIGDIVVEGSLDAQIKYEQKNPDSFNSELVEAIAEGVGPDVIILAHEDILRHKEKILMFPFQSLSERVFSDAFIDGAGIFRTPDGYIGLPFSIDPIVMYWNKSLFINEGIIRPPSYWDEFSGLAGKLTKKDSLQNVLQSFVSFGEYRNVNNAKSLISLLMLQAGTPIVRWNYDGTVGNYIEVRGENRLYPAEVALRFYTEFADPTKPTYSWNRSLPMSQKAFISGDLALYFGFASEVATIQNLNPNLNFDVAVVPQIRDSVEKATYGRFKAVSVLRSSRNPNTAYNVAGALSSATAMASMLETTTLPPVGRQFLGEKPLDPYKVVFYDSALIAKSWLEPDSQRISELFSDMIENITSGRMRVSESISHASGILDSLLKSI